MTTFIRVIVADDSPFICRLLTRYLDAEADLSVIQVVYNGKDAVDAVAALRPDVLTLDLNMPVLSGLDALEQIMTHTPLPVVLISGVSEHGARGTEYGLSLGAVDFILKYSPGTAIPPEVIRREIVAKVKAAAKVKMIRPIPLLKSRSEDHQKRRAVAESPIQAVTGCHQTPVVIIGASTGGPLALKSLLEMFCPAIPFSIVVVQHISPPFSSILAKQFDRLFPFTVKEADDGDQLSPGMVFIAPSNRHLLFNPDNTLTSSTAPKINGHRPSIDVTMQSAAQLFTHDVSGVLLSGMGSDGSRGMLAIVQNGGTTYAQSTQSCVIDSMPKTAIAMGVVHHIGTPEEIGTLLLKKCPDTPGINHGNHVFQ